VVGALVALDVAYLYRVVDFPFDGLRWSQLAVYLVGSLPVAAAGALLGKAASSLTRRWS